MKKVAVHSRRITDTPRGTPQASGNCGHGEDGDQVKGCKPEPKCLGDAMHNPDVADQGGEGNPAIQIKETRYAFVQHKDGTPLMPMRIGKAKKMVRSGKAKVVKCRPLVIRLEYDTDKHIDDLILGVDSGVIHIGFSVVNPILKREYICGTLEQEHAGGNSNPMRNRLADRNKYRRNRRYRLWYREARRDNRRSAKRKFRPSIDRKYYTHLHLIDKIKYLLPISKVIIEVAKFDVHKIINPNIKGDEYAKGDLYGYNNLRSYLMSREKGRCQFCGETFENRVAHIHHIIPRCDGGSNRASNLAILHKECHVKIHRENLLDLLSKPKLYREPAFMLTVNKRFQDDVPNSDITYGYITFVNRNKYGIAKSHANDAFVIAGGNPYYSRSVEVNLKQKRRNDRILQWNDIKRKNSGGRRIRRGRKPYRSGDMLFIDGEWKECKGMSNNNVVLGYHYSPKGNMCAESVNMTKVEKCYYNRGIYFVT